MIQQIKIVQKAKGAVHETVKDYLNFLGLNGLVG